MKTLHKAGLVAAAAAIVAAGYVIAAGSTVIRTPASVTAFALSNTSVTVDFAAGTMGATNIRFYCHGPEQGHFQVKVPKTQGITVGNITSVTETAWVDVTTGNTFLCSWVARATIRTTNLINNKVSIFVDGN